MTDEELLKLNRKGFIPGPGEVEGTFLERVERSLAVEGERLPRAHMGWVRERLGWLYGFEPESLVVSYSNEGLSWWEGAACWIGEDGGAKLQLREGFRKGAYWVYGRDEVVAHEAVHAARAAFNEPDWEEFFAYASGSKKWRRVLGPIVKRPWESWVAMGSVAGAVLIEPVGFFAACFLGVGFFRLIRQHRGLKRASELLMKHLGKERKVRSVLFRMTDKEIRELSRGRLVEGDDSLRWRLIRLIIEETEYGEKNNR